MVTAIIICLVWLIALPVALAVAGCVEVVRWLAKKLGI